MPAFYITRKNSMGYESAYCTNGEFVGKRYCYFPGEFKMNRLPVIKTWKSETGVRRWLNERPALQVEVQKV
jgi:hypothetical protein